MKRAGSLSLLFCIMSSSASVVAAPTADESAIIKIERDMAAGQTVDAVMGSWDKDAVWYDISPGEVVGLDAIRKDFAEQLKAVKNIRVTILRLKAEADNKIGYAYSTLHLLADGSDGKPNLVDFVFRQTDTYHKRHGNWLLTHQQIPLPVDLRSGKAVFDSK